MAGLYEMAQRLASAAYLLAAHRAGHVEDDADRDGRVFIAEEFNRLRLVLVED